MVTLEELRKKHQEIIEKNKGSGGSGQGADFATFHEGTNMIRILPGKSDQFDFFAESAVHKIPGEGGKFTNYGCRRTQNQECPVCDFYFDLWKTHKELNLGKDAEGKQKKSKFGNLATQIKVKPRYYVTAVIRELQAAKEEPVKYVAMSKELFDKVMGAITNPQWTDEADPDNTTIISLDRGNDFDVKITKKGDYNSFAESSPSPRKTKAGTPIEMAAWMEHKLDPKSLVKIGDYEEGKKIVQNLLASLDSVSTAGAPKTSPKKDEGDSDDKFNKEMKV